MTSSPTDHPLVKSVTEGTKRKLVRPIQPKDSLSNEAVTENTKKLCNPNASLVDIRFLSILLVGYAGIFHIIEILNIYKIKDVRVFDNYMTILVPKRKNNQYRRGHVSTVARSGKFTCPVNRKTFITFGKKQ